MKRSNHYESSYMDERKTTYKYDGLSKDRWNDFLTERELQMTDKEISYLDEEVQLDQRLHEPAPPGYIPYIQLFGMPAD